MTTPVRSEASAERLDRLRDQIRWNRARSEELNELAEANIRRALALCQAVRVTRLQTIATRDRATALRQRVDGRAPIGLADDLVQWFSVTGELAGQPVTAQWTRGHLEGGPTC